MMCHSTFFLPWFRMAHSRLSSYFHQPDPETGQRQGHQLKVQKLSE
jgi:hypothetical protein